MEMVMRREREQEREQQGAMKLRRRNENDNRLYNKSEFLLHINFNFYSSKMASNKASNFSAEYFTTQLLVDSYVYNATFSTSRPFEDPT